MTVPEFTGQYAHGGNIECTMCFEIVRPPDWVAHARLHNPNAYKPGWPCNCRPEKLCPVHAR